MKKIIFYFLSSIILFSSCNNSPISSKKLKLVIGIDIDQMRNDYLTRFADK